MARRYWDGGNGDGAYFDFRCDDDGDEGGERGYIKNGSNCRAVVVVVGVRWWWWACGGGGGRAVVVVVVVGVRWRRRWACRAKWSGRDGVEVVEVEVEVEGAGEAEGGGGRWSDGEGGAERGLGLAQMQTVWDEGTLMR